MKTLKNIFMVLSVVIIFVLFYVLSQPQDTKELDFLHKQNDSLLKSIAVNNKKIDSLELINNKLDSQRNILKSQLSKVGVKADKLKKQHEKNIQHLSTLSNNDITNLFADKFADIE